MPNNELFFRVAQEGLNDSDTIRDLIYDLGAAIESYLQGLAETDALSERSAIEEIEFGLRAARRLVKDIEAWTGAT